MNKDYFITGGLLIDGRKVFSLAAILNFSSSWVRRLQPRILGSGTVGNSGNIGKSDRFPRITNMRGSEDFSFPNLIVADHKIQDGCHSRKIFHASISSRLLACARVKGKMQQLSP